MPLAKIGEQVGLSAPAVIERIKKLEESGVIIGYRAIVDARRLGQGHHRVHRRAASAIRSCIGDVRAADRQRLDDVLECHHVTGGYTLLLKVKTDNTSTLEELISHLRSIEGVDAHRDDGGAVDAHRAHSRSACSTMRRRPRSGARRNGEQARCKRSSGCVRKCTAWNERCRLRKQGLYDPRFEHDACGVGFVANIKGVKSHDIVAEGADRCCRT